MVLKWFRGKSGEADAGGAKPAGDAVEYNGFTIQPAPQKTGGGWNTAGIISKEIGGEIIQLQEFALHHPERKSCKPGLSRTA